MLNGGFRGFSFVAASLVLVLIAGACFGASDDDGSTEVSSKPSTAGELATLIIPQGAIPENLDGDSISIVPFSEAERSELSDGPVFAAYSLEPEGAVFLKPIRLIMRLPQSVSNGAFQIALLSDGSESAQGNPVEPINITDLRLDEDTGQIEIGANLQHFSTVVVTQSFYEVSITSPDTVKVGDSFTATAVARKTGQKLSSFAKGEAGPRIVTSWADDGPWTVKGGYSAVRVTPGRLDNVPPLTTTSTDSFTSNAQFKCVEQGTYTLIYLSFIKYNEKYSVRYADGSSYESALPGSAGILMDARGECVDPNSSNSSSDSQNEFPTLRAGSPEIPLVDSAPSGEGGVTGQVPISTQVGLVTLSVIAFNGEIDPSTSPSGTVEFESLGLPTTGGGTVSFSGITRSGEEGIWQYFNDLKILSPVATESKSAPGVESGKFVSVGRDPTAVNAQGLIAFMATAKDDKGKFFDGIWIESGSGSWNIVRSEQPAPGLRIQKKFTNFKSPLMNSGGTVLFGAPTTGDSLWLGDGETHQPVLVEKGELPGVDAGWSVSGSYPIIGSGLNVRGQVLVFMEHFFQESEPDRPNTGIWLMDGGDFRRIAMNGMPAPGTDGTFIRFRRPTINDKGQVAFSADYEALGGPLGTQERSGIWKTTSVGRLVKVVVDSDKSPLDDRPIGFPNTPLIMEDGRVLFVAALDTDDLPCFFASSVLVENPTGEFEVIVRSDDLLASPEFGPCYDIGVKAANIVMNQNGHIAFSWSFGEGIWAQDSTGVLHRIVEAGDTIQVQRSDGSTTATVQSVEFVGGVSTATGRPSGFSDQGDVVFKAIFDNGSQAIILATFPPG